MCRGQRRNTIGDGDGFAIGGQNRALWNTADLNGQSLGAIGVGESRGYIQSNRSIFGTGCRIHGEGWCICNSIDSDVERICNSAGIAALPIRCGDRDREREVRITVSRRRDCKAVQLCRCQGDRAILIDGSSRQGCAGRDIADGDRRTVAILNTGHINVQRNGGIFRPSRIRCRNRRRIGHTSDRHRQGCCRRRGIAAIGAGRSDGQIEVVAAIGWRGDRQVRQLRRRQRRNAIGDGNRLAIGSEDGTFWNTADLNRQGLALVGESRTDIQSNGCVFGTACRIHGEGGRICNRIDGDVERICDGAGITTLPIRRGDRDREREVSITVGSRRDCQTFQFRRCQGDGSILIDCARRQGRPGRDIADGDRRTVAALNTGDINVQRNRCIFRSSSIRCRNRRRIGNTGNRHRQGCRRRRGVATIGAGRGDGQIKVIAAVRRRGDGEISKLRRGQRRNTVGNGNRLAIGG